MTEEATLQLGENWALLIIDMQNGFLDEKGFLGQFGLQDQPAESVIANVRRVLDAAREAGAPIFHTRFTLNADETDAGLATQFFGFPGGENGLVRDTWGNALVEVLTPHSGERVIDKPRYSAFHRTSLAEELAELGADTLVVCGVTADVCVQSTVRDAFDLDVMPVVPADAIAAASSEGYAGTLNAFGNAIARVSDVDTVIAAMGSVTSRHAS